MLDRGAIFEQHRGRIKSLAYRMLGSVGEAEDAVQDAGLRWLQSGDAGIERPEGWLVTVTTRICIDRLRQLAVQREGYFGRWLPDPIVTGLMRQPDESLERADDLSTVLLIVLERLSPVERAAFVLHEVFDYPFRRIATVLGKTEVACRQLAHRARVRVNEGRPRFEVSREAHERLVARFLDALQEGDEEALLGLLAEDARLASDGGGKVRVSKNGIFGAANITRLIAYGRLLPRQMRQELDRTSRRIVPINGEAGIITYLDGRLLSTISLRTNGLRILETLPDAEPGQAGPSRNPGRPHTALESSPDLDYVHFWTLYMVFPGQALRVH